MFERKVKTEALTNHLKIANELGASLTVDSSRPTFTLIPPQAGQEHAAGTRPAMISYHPGRHRRPIIIIMVFHLAQPPGIIGKDVLNSTPDICSWQLIEDSLDKS